MRKEGIVERSTPQPTWSQAVWLAIAASVVGSVLIAKFTPIKGGVFDGFNPFLIEMVTHHWHTAPADHRRILLAHKAFLTLTALAALVLTALQPTARAMVSNFYRPALTPVLLLLVIGGFGWSYFSFPGTPQDLLSGLVVLPGLAMFLHVVGKSSPRLATGLSLLSIGIACLPGLFLRPDLFELPLIDILQIQQHFTVCFSFGNQLAAGIDPGKEWLLHYGVIGPTLLGMIERATGIWTFRHLINLVQVSQIVFLTLLYLSLSRFARRSQFAAFAALLTVVPWYHCNQLGIFYPNHSGSRLLVVFAAIALIAVLGRRSPRSIALVMGLASGIAFLYNFETGLTLTIGFGLALLLRRKFFAGGTAMQFIGPYLFMALGAAGALAVFTALFLAATGTLPVLLNPAKLGIIFRVPQIITIEGVPAGIAVLMFAHATYVILRTALTDPMRITHFQSLKAGLALTLIIWEMYYFNRPYFAYLAGCISIYSILLIDIFRTMLVAMRGHRRRFLPGAVLGAFSLAIVIIPYTAMSYREAAPSYAKVWERLRLPRHLREWAIYRSQIVSGVALPKELGAYLAGKSQRLRELNGEGPLRYVTIYSLIVPKVSGVQQDFPYVDPYFGVNLVKQHWHYLAELKKGQPRLIAVDDPATDPVLCGESWYRTYIGAVEKDLALTYRVRERNGGWTIWEPRQKR